MEFSVFLMLVIASIALFSFFFFFKVGSKLPWRGHTFLICNPDHLAHLLCSFFLKAPPARLPFNCFSLLFFIIVFLFCQDYLRISSTSVISACSFLIPFTCSVFTHLTFSLNFRSHSFSYSCPNWMFSLLFAVPPAFLLYLLPTCPVHFFLLFFPLCSHHLLIFWFIFTLLLYDFLYSLASALSVTVCHLWWSYFLTLFATSDHDLRWIPVVQHFYLVVCLTSHTYHETFQSSEHGAFLLITRRLSSLG